MVSLAYAGKLGWRAFAVAFERVTPVTDAHRPQWYVALDDAQNKMQLLSYLGFLGQWPPPSRTPTGQLARLDHCLDTLTRAAWHHSDAPARTRLSISTTFEKRCYMREMILTDEIVTKLFCEFLNKHSGKTIKEIGELDVEFLG